ncbi:MAG: hypothetical protein ACR2NX_09605 [Chthoniobacterales bacterium]
MPRPVPAFAGKTVPTLPSATAAPVVAPTAPVVASAASPSIENTSSPISLPLVYQDAALQAANLAPEQAAAVVEIREQFTQDIGPQNIFDPEYLARWQAAHFNANDQLRATLGWAAFNQLSVASASAGP